jgi:hypothetical protein
MPMVTRDARLRLGRGGLGRARLAAAVLSGACAMVVGSIAISAVTPVHRLGY